MELSGSSALHLCLWRHYLKRGLLHHQHQAAFFFNSASRNSSMSTSKDQLESNLAEAKRMNKKCWVLATRSTEQLDYRRAATTNQVIGSQLIEIKISNYLSTVIKSLAGATKMLKLKLSVVTVFRLLVRQTWHLNKGPGAICLWREISLLQIVY